MSYDEREIQALQPGFSGIVGQERAKKALEIAASGGHNILLVGPPGCGKSMLAERFSKILPLLSTKERLEAVRIASIRSEEIESILYGARPFRAPHHGASEVGMIGGGPNLSPGEISLAHNGVLFLDEFPEFPRRVLEALRAPLETGVVNVTRAKGTVSYPAKFQMIAAMNPCPCGRLGMDSSPCRCSRQEMRKYLKKLSQPILERIDMQVAVDPVPFSTLSNLQVDEDEEMSERDRVRRIALLRKKQLRDNGKLNSELSHQELISMELTESAREFIEQASSELHSSARLFVRILRVARTIADLSGSEIIDREHIVESCSYRSLEKIWRYVESR